MRSFLLAFAALLIPNHAWADWTAFLPSATPPHFFAVDKEKDMLYRVTGPQGTRSVIKSCPTIHGSVEGDKQIRGDLKTPEGVYFITKKITQPLDFMDYGPHAFALNYPNPADRIREKKGGGIWLHSKGRPIKEVRTRGCVAIEQEDIRELVPVLSPGTPVMIAQRIKDPLLEEKKPEHAGKADTPEKEGQKASCEEEKNRAEHAASPDFYGEEKKVIMLSREWKKRFSEASGDLFELYDKKRWSKANREKFSAIEKRRTGEMKGEKTLDAEAEDVRVLSGPGYWTAFFERTIKEEGSERCGVQVLYWMPDENGEMRVIGDLWTDYRQAAPAVKKTARKKVKRSGKKRRQ